MKIRTYDITLKQPVTWLDWDEIQSNIALALIGREAPTCPHHTVAKNETEAMCMDCAERWPLKR
jgi:hypothetical protein